MLQQRQKERFSIDNGIQMITNQEGGGLSSIVVLIAVCGEGVTNSPLRRSLPLSLRAQSNRPSVSQWPEFAYKRRLRLVDVLSSTSSGYRGQSLNRKRNTQQVVAAKDTA